MERRDHIKSGCYIMEIQILHWFETLHNPITNPIFYVITTLVNAGWFWIVLAVLMLTVLPKKYKKAGLTMAIALILSLIFCNGIFNSIHDYSFPSGHSSASFAAAVSIFMWRKKEGSAALVLAALIAFSRLYFTVHYPTDVLVGTITGALYGVAAYFIVKALMNKVPKLNAIFNKQ